MSASTMCQRLLHNISRLFSTHGSHRANRRRAFPLTLDPTQHLERRTLLSAVPLVPKTGLENPFNGIDLGLYTIPVICDLDGDGDSDLLSGEDTGTVVYIKNIGSNSNLSFEIQTGSNNPLALVDVGIWSGPAVGDVDGDGDFDVLVGESQGKFFYYENVGSKTAPSFVNRTGSSNPFDSLDVGSWSIPTLGDIDADGDLDLLSGNSSGSFNFYRNVGTSVNPIYEDQTNTDNPFGGQLLQAGTTPSLGDLDGDGDLDLFTGIYDGTFRYYENVGTPVAPQFVPRPDSDNPLNGENVGIWSAPTIGDLNQDGALDVVSGNGDAKFFYYEQPFVEPPPDNHAPVLDPDGFPTLPATTKVDANLGISIPDLIASMGPDGGITDVDANALQGIAIIGRNNLNGTWEFTIDGGNLWQPLGFVSTTSARLLAANPQTRVRFVPVSTYVGNSGITYLAWDQTSGVNGGLADTSIRGGSSAFSTKKEQSYVTIIDNHAPVLNPNGNPKLPDYANNGGPNAGMLIDDLIAAMGPNGGITDVDPDAERGIAVIGANNVSGTWEFSTNNGTSWLPVGSANSLASRLLAANATTRLRFVPKPGFVGTVGLTFLAWDQTDGSNGGTGNTTYRGKTAAYSQQKEDIFITITGNRAPILNPAGNPKLPDLPHASSTNNGMLISDLIASMGPSGGITDPDPAALKGIAIIGANNVAGTWEFSTNNGTSWASVGSTTSISARLLAADATTRIRFVPKPGFVGTIGFTFLAWDRTSGANGGLASTLLRGGTTSFSNDKDNAYITVT